MVVFLSFKEYGWQSKAYLLITVTMPSFSVSTFHSLRTARLAVLFIPAK